MPASEPSFSCPACGARFVWTEALSGKRVRCSCKAWIDVPQHAHVDTPIGNPQIRSGPPSPVQALATFAVAHSASAPLNYRSAKREFDPEHLKNFQMPLVLLIGGVLVQAIADLIHYHGDIASAAILVSAQLFVGTTIMLAGIMLAAKLRGVRLGKFWTVVFKLAAISVAPSAVAAITAPVLTFVPLGFLIGFAVEFCLYFALLGVLFDLDESDTWYCVFVIFFVQIATYVVLAYTLFKYF